MGHSQYGRSVFLRVKILVRGIIALFADNIKNIINGRG